MALYVFAVILNFLVNFLLIIGTNQVIDEHSNLKRTIAAAAFGGIYAGICLRFYALGAWVWRLCVLFLMSKLAFGRAFGKRGLLMLVLHLAVSGIAAGLYTNGLWSVILTVLGGAAMLIVGLMDRRRKLVPVELSYEGKRVQLTALRDTGNTLRDPLTGKPILVIGADAALELTGLTQSQLRQPVDTMTKRFLPGLRLIPYRTIDKPEGMLLGLWIRDSKIGKHRCGTLVAFAPERLSEDGSIQALTGGTV